MAQSLPIDYFITFLFTVNVIRQMAPLFSKVDSNNLLRDVQNEENVIYAQFGKDLFNISKVIGRKKVAQFFLTHSVYPFDDYNCCHIGTAIKHHMPDRVKPSFLIFDIRALSPERQSARMSKISKDGSLNPVWHRMLYSCTRMATVGVKGINAYMLEGLQ